MSDTPRVDAETHWTTSHDGFFELEPNPKGHWVPADFARELERELNALKKDFAALKTSNDWL